MEEEEVVEDTPFEFVLQHEMIRDVHKALDRIGGIHSKVLRMYYGIECRARTLSDIGDNWGELMKEFSPPCHLTKKCPGNYSIESRKACNRGECCSRCRKRKQMTALAHGSVRHRIKVAQEELMKELNGDQYFYPKV